MSYRIKYRGGPKHNHNAVIPTLDNEIPLMTYTNIKLNVSDFMDPNLSPTALIPPVKRGVYSRVFTPTKKGVYLYVWVEQ